LPIILKYAELTFLPNSDIAKPKITKNSGKINRKFRAVSRAYILLTKGIAPRELIGAIILPVTKRYTYIANKLIDTKRYIAIFDAVLKPRISDVCPSNEKDTARIRLNTLNRKITRNSSNGSPRKKSKSIYGSTTAPKNATKSQGNDGIIRIPYRIIDNPASK